jgi:ferredoxin
VIYRNKRLLELLREAPCQVCGIEDGTVVAAHSNQLRDGKGRSMKSHDFRCASMCYTCHTRCDQGADLSKAERVEMWEEAHRKTIGWLFLNDHVKIL